jgi:hypothetical protein
MPVRGRTWVVDILVGGLLGGVGGAIVAVNLVIFSGMSRGYETTVPQIFDENLAVGVIVIAVLAAGPVVGILLTRRLRRR